MPKWHSKTDTLGLPDIGFGSGQDMLYQEIVSRNSATIKALDDDYTQGEIACYLVLSAAMVSKVFRAER